MTNLFVCTDADVLGSFCPHGCWIRWDATTEVCDSCGAGRYIPSPMHWETDDELYARIDMEHERLMVEDPNYAKMWSRWFPESEMRYGV